MNTTEGGMVSIVTLLSIRNPGVQGLVHRGVSGMLMHENDSMKIYNNIMHCTQVDMLEDMHCNKY